MNRLYIFSFLLMSAVIGTGQNKLFTIDEAVIGQWREFYPETKYNLQWRGNSDKFTYQDNEFLFEQTANDTSSVILLTLNELNQMLRIENLDTVAYFPDIKWESIENFHFYGQNFWCEISLKNNKVKQKILLPDVFENNELNYATKTIAYTVNNNVYIIDTNQIPTQITYDSDKNIVNGQIVSRNEFGITKGIFWSESGKNLAFYRKNELQVNNYPLVDITKREAEVHFIKYPMAGMNSEHISLGVYNLSTKKTIFIEADDTLSEKYLTNITWDPNDTYIYIQVLNRAQNYMKLNKYNALTGKFEATLFDEKHDKYVEPYYPLLFLKDNPNEFIYQTRTAGFNHAYLYNTSGKLIKQLTAGNWEITQINYLSNTNLYFTSTEATPLERHFYKINLKSGKKVKLTQALGTHEIVFNGNEKYFIDTYSNLTTPRVITLFETSGKPVRNILTATNPLNGYDVPTMELGTLKAADGQTDLYYHLIKPLNFDVNKKYPTIVYVYGGPHAQLIENSWLGGTPLWEYYMAQKGYVIFALDNRGSANRGLAFENAIHRQCGVVEMADQLKGVEFLKNLGYVDADKIGIHGWSYGGFMTTSLMVNYPNVFKVGVAGGPVIDWKYYEVMYGERYMDTPDENPDGYASTSLVNRASDLKGKLLIIQGAVDSTVVMQHSMVFIQECIKKHVPIDYFIYPRAEHNVRGYDRIHLMQKVTQYFDDYLK